MTQCWTFKFCYIASPRAISLQRFFLMWLSKNTPTDCIIHISTYTITIQFSGFKVAYHGSQLVAHILGQFLHHSYLAFRTSIHLVTLIYWHRNQRIWVKSKRAGFWFNWVYKIIEMGVIRYSQPALRASSRVLYRAPGHYYEVCQPAPTEWDTATDSIRPICTSWRG